MSPIIVLLAVTVTLSGAAPPARNELPAAVRSILENADGVELYSLDAPAGAGMKAMFRGRKVLGKTAITGEKARALLDQVLKSLSPLDREKGQVLITNPWHGLRVTHQGKSVDLLIDFRWHRLSVHLGENNLGRFATSRKAQATLDELLREGKVAISANRKEEDKPSVLKTFLEKGELIEVYSGLC